LRTCTNHM